MKKKTLEDINVFEKKVLVRVDFNVPIQDGVITDDNRIVQALPTIQYLLDESAKVILFSHLGRIKKEEDLAKNSLKIVSERLSELLGKEVVFVPETRGEKLEKAINDMKAKDIVMVENTRFEDLDGKKESKNDDDLGAYWASLGDVFVNDAFGTAHRAHASNVGIASRLETAAGYLMEKEIRYIGSTVEEPERPFVAILGGAKVSDKIGVIENLLKVADKVLIGGGMAYTFMKAQGYNIGNSIVENDKLDLANELLEKAKGKIILPKDLVVAEEFSASAPFRVTDYKGIKDTEEGLDVGPKTIKLFKKHLKHAKTVVWNGPLGVFEFENFAKGTEAICEILAHLKNARTIIGGGDSAAAAIQMGYKDKFTHISTGGGASLQFLEGKPLPGIDSIDDSVDCGCGDSHCGH
ncbi:MAG: phosphoglycerate kinase [Candidatus Izemoplasmatales bacterium]|uniref:Phosphoglycerate kinase n=1 Tax=Hujiaoplasma nucleasis TaxID=2725268 RepID=A0A7L6N4Y8_9MOLU|nr:phosphoglycerate kinase [Hujiaoplasma nucleasis]QLY40065.1 phosphoglycerate kinase [Hujiaoplasma nucleasis]